MNILRLKEILKEKGVAGKDLASKVGVTPTSISNISNGNHFPKPDLLIAIAKELDIDVKDLFYSTKETQSDTLYIKKGGEFVAVGKLLKN